MARRKKSRSLRLPRKTRVARAGWTAVRYSEGWRITKDGALLTSHFPWSADPHMIESLLILMNEAFKDGEQSTRTKIIDTLGLGR